MCNDTALSQNRLGDSFWPQTESASDLIVYTMFSSPSILQKRRGVFFFFFFFFHKTRKNRGGETKNSTDPQSPTYAQKEFLLIVKTNKIMVTKTRLTTVDNE